jgi:hypothetical protein
LPVAGKQGGSLLEIALREGEVQVFMHMICHCLLHGLKDGMGPHVTARANGG